MSIRLLTGDCRETLSTQPTASVQAVITSPPYYGLRDYGTPPLVWGGDAEHEHEWDVSLRSVERGAGNWTQAANGTELRTGVHQTRFKGDVVAARATERENVATAICSCGAWLGSLGLEPTPELFIEHLVEVFRHVRRVLRDDGVLWLNLGDSYVSNGRYDAAYESSHKRQALSARTSEKYASGDLRPGSKRLGLKPKDLMMMPFRVAMALQQDGWWLRSVIPWIKFSAMPESVTDRPASAIEYWFMLTKSARYFYDPESVRQRSVNPLRQRNQERIGGTNGDSVRHSKGSVVDGTQSSRSFRNTDLFIRSWQGLMLDEQDDPLALVVNPAPFTGSHFATFPPKLVEPMVKASTRTGDTVLDCFSGVGTVGLVADRLQRNAILCELKPEYVDMGSARITNDAPMFADLDIA
jgi:DNA modification methylase